MQPAASSSSLLCTHNQILSCRTCSCRTAAPHDTANSPATHTLYRHLQHTPTQQKTNSPTCWVTRVHTQQLHTQAPASKPAPPPLDTPPCPPGARYTRTGTPLGTDLAAVQPSPPSLCQTTSPLQQTPHRQSPGCVVPHTQVHVALTPQPPRCLPWPLNDTHQLSRVHTPPHTKGPQRNIGLLVSQAGHH